MIATISSAGQALRQGRLSCVDLLEQCLTRIDQLEERVRAWVLVDRDRARADAHACDRELASGHDRGPLHGIPMAIKDIFDVFDWPTACGSRLWEQAIARQDAPVVRRLRQAGAVLVGKTVTTAYASFDPPPTRNPWNLAHTPGGSSSGSAAALACGTCLAALASQTGGSITRPASYCGVPACKPTYGLISTEGVMPLAASMDHVGAMARCVHDVALVMQAIADPGPRHWTMATTGSSRPPVLGRLRGLFDRLADDTVRQMMDAVCRRLAEAGARIEDVELPPGFEEVLADHRVIMACEAAEFHQERMARHPDDYPPRIRSLIEEGLACSGPRYARARAQQKQLALEFAPIAGHFDAVLCPATTRPAPDASTTGDPAFNSPWSFTGLPVVSFPVGLSPDGLPLGIQVVGPARSEGSLFQVAAWSEQALGVVLGEPPVR